jgi:glutamate-5-semialdehyde dehydrogenase
MLDRLKLDDSRLEAIAAAVEQVAALPDQVGQVIDRSVAPSGLELSRVRIRSG